jgi:hypothetical protein
MWPLSFPLSCVKFPLTRFNLSLQSPLCAWGSSNPILSPPSISSPHMGWVPLNPILSPPSLCAQVRFLWTQFSFTSLCYRSMVPNVKL